MASRSPAPRPSPRRCAASFSRTPSRGPKLGADHPPLTTTHDGRPTPPRDGRLFRPAPGADQASRSAASRASSRPAVNQAGLVPADNARQSAPCGPAARPGLREQPPDGPPTGDERDRRHRQPAHQRRHTRRTRPCRAYTITWISGTNSARRPVHQKVARPRRPRTRPEPTAGGQRRVRRLGPARAAVAPPRRPPGRRPSTGPPRSAPAADGTSEIAVRPAPAAVSAGSPARCGHGQLLPAASPNGPARRLPQPRRGAPRQLTRRRQVLRHALVGSAPDRASSGPAAPLPDRPVTVASALIPAPPARTADHPASSATAPAPCLDRRTVPERHPFGRARHSTGRPKTAASCAAGTSSPLRRQACPPRRPAPAARRTAARPPPAQQVPARRRPVPQHAPEADPPAAPEDQGRSNPEDHEVRRQLVVRVREQRRQVHHAGRVGGRTVRPSALCQRPGTRVRCRQQEPRRARRVMGRCAPGRRRQQAARRRTPPAPRGSAGRRPQRYGNGRAGNVHRSTEQGSRPVACPASAARLQGIVAQQWPRVAGEHPGGPTPQVRAANSSCRSRSTTSGWSCGSGCRISRSCHGSRHEGAQPTGGVHHRTADRRPAAESSSAPAPGCRQAAPPSQRKLAEHRIPMPDVRAGAQPQLTARPTPGVAVRPTDTGPARPARAAPRRQPVPLGERPTADCPPTHDPGQRPVLAQLGRSATTCPLGRLRPARTRPSTVRADPARTHDRQPSPPPAPAGSRPVPLGLEELHEGLTVPEVHQIEGEVVRAVTGRPARATPSSGTPHALPRSGHHQPVRGQLSEPSGTGRPPGVTNHCGQPVGRTDSRAAHPSHGSRSAKRQPGNRPPPCSASRRHTASTRSAAGPPRRRPVSSTRRRLGTGDRERRPGDHPAARTRYATPTGWPSAAAPSPRTGQPGASRHHQVAAQRPDPCSANASIRARIRRAGQLRAAPRSQQQRPVVPASPTRPRRHPLLRLGQHRAQTRHVHRRRRQQTRIAQRAERAEHSASGIHRAHQQRTRRRRTQQPQQHGPQQPCHPRLPGVGVHTQVPRPDQRHQRGETSVVQRCSRTHPHERRRAVTCRRICRERIQEWRPTNRSRRSAATRQTVGQLVLATLVRGSGRGSRRGCGCGVTTAGARRCSAAARFVRASDRPPRTPLCPRLATPRGQWTVSQPGPLHREVPRRCAGVVADSQWAAVRHDPPI